MQDARWGAERNLMRPHIIPVAALTDFFNAVKENGELDERNVKPQDFRNYDESPSFGDVLHDVTLNAYGSYQYGAMDPKVKEERQAELEGGQMNYDLAKKRKWQNWLKFGNRGAMGTFMDPH